MTSPPPLRRWTTLGRLLAGAFLAVLVTACATPTPVRQVGLNRETPQATYEYFKTMARNNQWAAEWAVFSPNFKAMINQQAGRNVDLGDYVTARQTIASNSTAEMSLLLNSQLQGVQMIGPDRARITITGGGRSISPTLVRMTRWELRIKGEDNPATGLVTSPGDAVHVATDGSVTVRVQADPGAAAYLRTIPRDRIEGFAIVSEWYVDDFGGLGGAVGGARPAPSTAPAAPTPGPSTPSGPVGSGSPDA